MPNIKLPLEDKFYKIIEYLDGDRVYDNSSYFAGSWREYPKSFRGNFLYSTKAHGAELSRLKKDYFYPGYFLVNQKETLFSFSKDLKELLPENTYVKNIKLFLYINGGVNYISSPADIELSFQKGEPENPNTSKAKYNAKYAKHLFKNGWNEFDFTEDFIDNEAKFRSLIINLFSDSIHIENFNYSNREFHYISRETLYNSLLGYGDFNSSNPPYAIVEYAFNKPKNADSLAPDNKTVNPRTPIKFTWNTKIVQTAYELSYSVNGGSYTTISDKTVNRFYNMPADTIKTSSGSVNWRVRVKDESDTWSEYQEASFELGVPEQVAPRLIYPTGSYIKNTEPLEFSWAFVPDTIEQQQSFELQYRINNDDWESIRELTNRTNYTLNNIRSFGTSTGQWRVKVTNNFGEESQWSEIGKFQVYGVPPLPQIISVTNKNYPVISWYSDQQEMFRVIVTDKENNLVYDSDFILDYTLKEFKIPKVISNGKYTFNLMIKNKYGINSETASLTQEINVNINKTANIDIFSSDYYLTITSNIKKFKLLRNGKTIGESDNGEFKDFTCANNKLYKYQIMVNEDDKVYYSKETRAKVNFVGCTLAVANNLEDFVILRYNKDDRPSRTHELGIEANEIEIEGYKYPFIEYGTSIKDNKSYSFFIKDKDKLLDLLNKRKEFLLRDYYGENIYGLIKDISLTETRFGYELAFTITRTDDKYE